MLAVACDGVSLDLGVNWLSYRLSGSNQFFRREDSAQGELCVGSPWLPLPSYRVDTYTHKSAWGSFREQIGAKELISNYNVPVNHLEILLDCGFWLGSSGMAPKFIIFQ